MTTPQRVIDPTTLPGGHRAFHDSHIAELRWSGDGGKFATLELSLHEIGMPERATDPSYDMKLRFDAVTSLNVTGDLAESGGWVLSLTMDRKGDAFAATLSGIGFGLSWDFETLDILEHKNRIQT